MRKIRRVCMTLALAVLLAGMTACGNNTTNDTGNGNTNTESDMGPVSYTHLTLPTKLEV